MFYCLLHSTLHKRMPRQNCNDGKWVIDSTSCIKYQAISSKYLKYLNISNQDFL